MPQHFTLATFLEDKMFNPEYVKKYNELTGRDLEKDTHKCFQEMFNLQKYMTRYGFKNTELIMRLWRKGVTVETVQLIEKTNNEWVVLETLGKALYQPNVKDLPLIQTGIVKTK
jgi:hypothetical protein